MTKSLVRTRWDRKRRTVRMAVTSDRVATQQQFKDECDMNRIVKNAMRGVQPRFMARGVPQYGDFSNVKDLGQAYELIQRAEEGFMALPAELRRELHNDPRLLQHITADQVKRYGLGKVKAAESEAEAPPSPASSEPKAPNPPSTPPKSKKAATPPPEE